ncbi:MAG: ribosome silencing factor [Acidimicrobiia bacterium]
MTAVPSAPVPSSRVPGAPASSIAIRDSLRRAAVAAHAAAEKKGEDIVVLDVGDIISITDAFVLVSATNTRLVRTIVEEIELALELSDDEGPRSTEGLSDASWVLMDFGDVIVHVFLDETRAYYDLERLWADAPTVEWELLPAL